MQAEPEWHFGGALWCLITPPHSQIVWLVQEERKLLEGYKGPMDQLAAVEQFLLQVGGAHPAYGCADFEQGRAMAPCSAAGAALLRQARSMQGAF